MHKAVKLAKEEVELVRVDIINNTCCLYRQEEATVQVIRTRLRLKALRMPKCSKGQVSMTEWELEIWALHLEVPKWGKALVEETKCSLDFQIFSSKTRWIKTVKSQGKVVVLSRAWTISSILELLELKSIQTVSEFLVIIFKEAIARKLQMDTQVIIIQCLQMAVFKDPIRG